MVSLMQRRREMMQRVVSPSTLITFDTMTYGTTGLSEPYGQVKTSNGNHFYYYNRRRNYGAYISPHECANAFDASWPAILEAQVGDVIDMHLKNFIVSGAASNSPIFTVALASATGSSGYMAGFSNGYTGNGDNRIRIAVGDLGDFEAATTVTADYVARAIRIYMNASGQGTGGPKINFDLEVYKNGTRII